MLDKDKLYYLSHPFTTHGDRKENQEKAADIEMRLREKHGIKVINPILLPLGPDSDKAMKQCKYLHDACDETIFCDDWDKSEGCKKEFAWCSDLNRRYHLTELLLEDEVIDWLEKFKKRKLAVHCSTEYEANILMDILKKEGFDWRKGKTLIDNMWNLYKKGTCYVCDSEFFDKLRRFSITDTCAKDFKIITIDNILNENKLNWLEKFEDGKLVIHCSIEKEAIEFLNIMDKNGYMWGENDRLINETLWYQYKEKTCYCSQKECKKIINYADKEYFIKERRDILEFKDIEKEFFKENKEKSLDNNIDHPFHYNQGIECIDYIESHDFNFNLGNAVKYISRCRFKGNKENDINKAIWYLKRELEKENK